MISVCSKGEQRVKARLADTEALEKADAICDKVGLHERIEKQRKFLNEGRPWGWWFDADTKLGLGVVKTAELWFVTAWALFGPGLDRWLAQKLVGSWGFALQFHKMFFSLFQESIPGSKSPRKVC